MTHSRTFYSFKFQMLRKIKETKKSKEKERAEEETVSHNSKPGRMEKRKAKCTHRCHHYNHHLLSHRTRSFFLFFFALDLSPSLVYDISLSLSLIHRNNYYIIDEPHWRSKIKEEKLRNCQRRKEVVFNMKAQQHMKNEYLKIPRSLSLLLIQKPS